MHMSAVCSHLDSIEITELPERIEGCEDCFAIGGRRLHMRTCERCGYPEHPIPRSVDKIAFVVER
jgi:hypothetical protein